MRAAEKAANFILKKLRDEKGRLFHCYRKGEASVTGFLHDYAFLTWSLIELYETCFEAKYLKSPLELTDIMIDHFWDRNSRGFYHTADDAEKILIKKKEIYDGATPPGSSVAALNLLRLTNLTDNLMYRGYVEKIFSILSNAMSASPENYMFMLLALDFALGPII